MFTVTPCRQGAYEAWTLADTSAGTAAVIVPEKGGMAVSFTKNGDEYLWLRHPNFEQPERPRCGVPICFPVCGPTPEAGNAYLGGHYPMTVHGVGHSLPWTVAGTSAESGACITLALHDSPATRESYPFAFCVQLTYTLRGTVLTVAQTYENTGSVPMPFNFGFHPYFAVSAIDNLAWDIRADSVRDAATGVLTPFTGVDFPYDPAETVRHYAGVRSPMRFADRGTGHRVAVHFDSHFANVVLWQQGAERFVCMEPWNGYPGALAAGDAVVLPPQKKLDAQFAIEI